MITLDFKHQRHENPLLIAENPGTKSVWFSVAPALSHQRQRLPVRRYLLVLAGGGEESLPAVPNEVMRRQRKGAGDPGVEWWSC